MRRKMRMAVQNLSYCGGCEIALTDLGGKLLGLLEERVDLVYGPLFMSAEDYEDVDVVFLTGAVRNEEDVEQVRKARERARYVVSFGSCASLGGIPGLANMYGTEELLKAAYEDAPSVEGGVARPSMDIPALADQIQPVEQYVKVDFVLDGCPPLPPMIGEFLASVMGKVRIEEV
jgi:F420-non-reducing hydrogenase small subunit